MDEVGRCQVPNCQYGAAECHEITRGINRQASLRERTTWLGLCHNHHVDMGDYSVWPIERQIALKMIVDGEYFDLEKVFLVYGKRIEFERISKYLRLKE